MTSKRCRYGQQKVVYRLVYCGAERKRNSYCSTYFPIILMAVENNIDMALSPEHLLSEERVLRIPPLTSIREKGKARVDAWKIYDKVTRIATWNVRSLFMSGKLANVELEMNRLNIDILGLSEVRWPGSGRLLTNHGSIFYSGGSDEHHRYGVAILLTSAAARAVLDFVPLSDRVMLLRLQTSHRIMNVIQVYAPTGDKPDEEIEKFYNDLQELLRVTKRGEITYIMGDFNAKVGTGVECDAVGEYGLGERNDRGDRLVEFCVEHHLLVANTFFKLHPRRLYTWTSPADKPEHLVRNQIDFILLPTHWKKYIKSVKTYPGADIGSDHNPVVMEFRLHRFKSVRLAGALKQKKVNVQKLLDPQFRATVGEKFEEKLTEIRCNQEKHATWSVMETVLGDVQENLIGHVESNKGKQWMTDEILLLMNERRLVKNKDQNKYKEIKRLVRRKCREAKEKWLGEKCTEIEELQSKFDSFNLHKKVKELANKGRKHQAAILRGVDNEIVLGMEKQLSLWKEYVESLFNDDRPSVIPTCKEEDSGLELGPDISKEEVAYAIRLQKNGRAVGPDHVYAEVLKVIAETDGCGLALLTSLFNAIYATGQIPESWLRSTFLPLPKKAGASSCDDFRMISIMSHALKIFLRVIHARIYRKCEAQIADTQFGFRNGVGTREALFSLSVLTQRCRDVNCDVYACFVDYQKAFDCVSHEKMVNILKASKLDVRDINVIMNLYWGQTAEIRLFGGGQHALSEAVSIKRGVRQGCVLSPILFNIYSEKIFQRALDETSVGILVNGKPINCIRYADDTVILASSQQDLQILMDRVVECSEEFGLRVNVKKTKVMVFSKTTKPASITISGRIVEQVASYKYLGVQVNEQCDPRKEIVCRIAQSRSAFAVMKPFFVRSELSLELRLRMLRCYIFSIFMYGCEAWTLDAYLEKRIEALEMYFYRRILRISWVRKVTNEEVLRRLQKEKELLFTIKERKARFLGHIMRGERYEVLRLIIQGKIMGRRSVGRRKNSWLRDLRRWFSCSSTDLFRAAASRVRIAIWIANLRLETAS